MCVESEFEGSICRILQPETKKTYRTTVGGGNIPICENVDKLFGPMFSRCFGIRSLPGFTRIPSQPCTRCQPTFTKVVWCSRGKNLIRKPEKKMRQFFKGPFTCHVFFLQLRCFFRPVYLWKCYYLIWCLNIFLVYVLLLIFREELQGVFARRVWSAFRIQGSRIH